MGKSPRHHGRIAWICLAILSIQAGCASRTAQVSGRPTPKSRFLLVSQTSHFTTGDSTFGESVDYHESVASVNSGAPDKTQGPVIPATHDSVALFDAAPMTLQNDGESDEEKNEEAGITEDEKDAESEAKDDEPEGAGGPGVENLAAGLPIDYFVQQALASHPKIQAARHRVAAAVNRIPQERSLGDPAISETFWPFNGNALQTAGGSAANQLSLSQKVPWLEKLSTKAAIASREVQVARAEVHRIKREIEEAVQLACIEVAYASQAIEIINETDTLITHLTTVAESRILSGGSQQDVKRIQIESYRLEDKRVQLIKQKQVAIADLATLLNRPTEDLPEVSVLTELTDSVGRIDELILLAEQYNPELQGLAWQVARDQEKQRLACLQNYPDFQFGVNWLIISQSDAISPVANGNDNVAFTVGMTLPIWREKISAGIREAAHDTAGTAQLLNSQRDIIHGKLRRLISQADALREQRDIYSNRIIPRIEDTFTLALADYSVKRSDFFSLVETYREMLMFQLQLARINATLMGTLVQIERVVGRPNLIRSIATE